MTNISQEDTESVPCSTDLSLAIAFVLNDMDSRHAATSSRSTFLLKYFQQDGTLHSLFISGKLLYIVRVVSPPIIRSIHNCIYRIWHISNRYCYLPLSRQVACAHHQEKLLYLYDTGVCHSVWLASGLLVGLEL